MGFFEKLFGKHTQPTQPTYSSPKPSNYNNSTSGINLSKEEAKQKLNLRKETFKVCLTKKNMTNTVARVCVVMDKSGSMQNLYSNGTVQSVIERLLPLALKFDDNGELEVWLFNEQFQRLDNITEHDFYGYVDREIMKKYRSWGGTRYAPVIKDVVKKYVKEEPSNIPTFVIFITDGENTDREEAELAIREASKHNIFWQFIGIGDERFKFLKNLDTMEGRVIDNANFFEVNNLNHISDEELYDMLLNEYPSWEKEAHRIGIIK